MSISVLPAPSCFHRLMAAARLIPADSPVAGLMAEATWQRGGMGLAPISLTRIALLMAQPGGGMTRLPLSQAVDMPLGPRVLSAYAALVEATLDLPQPVPFDWNPSEPDQNLDDPRGFYVLPGGCAFFDLVEAPTQIMHVEEMYERSVIFHHPADSGHARMSAVSETEPLRAYGERAIQGVFHAYKHIR